MSKRSEYDLVKEDFIPLRGIYTYSVRNMPNEIMDDPPSQAMDNGIGIALNLTIIFLYNLGLVLGLAGTSTGLEKILK